MIWVLRNQYGFVPKSKEKPVSVGEERGDFGGIKGGVYLGFLSTKCASKAVWPLAVSNLRSALARVGAQSSGKGDAGVSTRNLV